MKLELLLNIEISNQIQSFGIDYLTRHEVGGREL